MASDGFRRRDAATIRPHVWIAAGALIVSAAAVLALRPVAEPSAASAVQSAPRPDAPVAVAPTVAARDSISASVAAAEPANVATPAADRATSTSTAAAFARANASASSAAARTQIDSRLASDLRIVEDEAARRAESLGLPVPNLQRGDEASGRDGGDAQRAALADAFLVEYFVQDAYRGTDFPLGFPAAQRTREAAISRVAGLDPAQRSAHLEVALQQAQEEPVPPRFEAQNSGLVWEAAVR